MSACAVWLCSSHRDLVFPEGIPSVPIDEAQRVKLLAGELGLADSPICLSAYPPYIFLLSKSPDVTVLKKALASALRAHPAFAGRIVGEDLVFSNSGVPFTVVRSKRATAPAFLEDTSFPSLGDVRRWVKSGQEPLLTLRLTMYRDGSAILALAASHAIADGTYMWAFIKSLAQAARGEVASKATADQRQQARGKIIPEEKFRTTLEAVLGRRPSHYPFLLRSLRHATAVLDCGHRLGFCACTGCPRCRIFFSWAELELIKAAATPSGTAGAWVSTQEALSAHILLSLARAILPDVAAKRATRTGLYYTLDVRSALGMQPETPGGVLDTLAYVCIPSILQLTLREVAELIHDSMHDPGKSQFLRDQWSFTSSFADHHYTVEHSLLLGQMLRRDKDGPLDFVLRLNNLSKKELPDFGATGGGKALAAMVLTGPSLLVPEAGGVALHLGNETLRRVPRAGRQEALRCLKEMPPSAHSARNGNPALQQR